MTRPARVTDGVGGLGQAGGHEADEIGFDLEVDVVGVHVVFGRAGFGCGDAALEGPTSGEVGVPEPVLGFAEHGAEIIGGGVEAFVVEDLGEGHVDIEVVLIERVTDALGSPLDGRPR